MKYFINSVKECRIISGRLIVFLTAQLKARHSGKFDRHMQHSDVYCFDISVCAHVMVDT